MEDAFKAQRDVSFFLRIHGHLPDRVCGDSFPFGKCLYSPNLEPINSANDYVEKLRKNPEYVLREKAVQEAQSKGLPYTNTSLTPLTDK
jgi:hypothetical protein